MLQQASVARKEYLKGLQTRFSSDPNFRKQIKRAESALIAGSVGTIHIILALKYYMSQCVGLTSSEMDVIIGTASAPLSDAISFEQTAIHLALNFLNEDPFSTQIHHIEKSLNREDYQSAEEELCTLIDYIRERTHNELTPYKMLRIICRVGKKIEQWKIFYPSIS